MRGAGYKLGWGHDDGQFDDRAGGAQARDLGSEVEFRDRVGGTVDERGVDFHMHCTGVHGGGFQRRRWGRRRGSAESRSGGRRAAAGAGVGDVVGKFTLAKEDLFPGLHLVGAFAQ